MGEVGESGVGESELGRDEAAADGARFGGDVESEAVVDGDYGVAVYGAVPGNGAQAGDGTQATAPPPVDLATGN